MVGFPPKSSILIGFPGFPLFKPSILGYHYFWNPPYVSFLGAVSHGLFISGPFNKRRLFGRVCEFPGVIKLTILISKPPHLPFGIGKPSIYFDVTLTSRLEGCRKLAGFATGRDAGIEPGLGA